MANNIQQSLLQSIDYLVKNRIDQIQVDKTVIATIHSCTNALIGEYKVNYNGGQMFAYAQNGTTYTKNTEVYVQIPLGDFSQKKNIVSKTQKITEDNNITFVAAALSNYNLIGKNPINQTETFQEGLHSYLKDDVILFYQRLNPEDSQISIDAIALKNSLLEADALLIEASFFTRLPQEHRRTLSGDYGLVFRLAFKDANNPEKIKTYDYVIDVNHMTGNPFSYTSWTEQYGIYQIDTENFLYIDAIYGYSKDFVEEDNAAMAKTHGADIFIKDLEIYGLKTIASENEEYQLKIGTPSGITFYSILENETLPVIAKFMQKNNNNLSDNTTFYWFVEDNRVTSTNKDYNMYGGSGWRYLKDKGYGYSATFSGHENRAGTNKYLCVGVYQESVVLKEKFNLYNEACKRDITIVSSLGDSFSFDRGFPVLTCKINNKASNFEEDLKEQQEFYHEDSLFQFVWSKTDENGQKIVFNQTPDEIDTEINTLLKETVADKISEEVSTEEKKATERLYDKINVLKSKKEQLSNVQFTP